MLIMSFRLNKRCKITEKMRYHQIIFIKNVTFFCVFEYTSYLCGIFIIKKSWKLLLIFFL